MAGTSLTGLSDAAERSKGLSSGAHSLEEGSRHLYGAVRPCQLPELLQALRELLPAQWLAAAATRDT